MSTRFPLNAVNSYLVNKEQNRLIFFKTNKPEPTTTPLPIPSSIAPTLAPLTPVAIPVAVPVQPQMPMLLMSQPPMVNAQPVVNSSLENMVLLSSARRIDKLDRPLKTFADRKSNRTRTIEQAQMLAIKKPLKSNFLKQVNDINQQNSNLNNQFQPVYTNLFSRYGLNLDSNNIFTPFRPILHEMPRVNNEYINKPMKARNYPNNHFNDAFYSNSKNGYPNNNDQSTKKKVNSQYDDKLYVKSSIVPPHPYNYKEPKPAPKPSKSKHTNKPN